MSGCVSELDAQGAPLAGVSRAAIVALAAGLALLAVAYRPALIPIITVIGLQTARLLGGATIVEMVFSWPGAASLLLEGIFARDYPVVQGGVLVLAVTYVAVNLVVDIAYRWIDPRVRLA